MNSEIQIRLEKLIMSIKTHPDYLKGKDGDEWHDLISLAEESIKNNKEVELINTDNLNYYVKERLSFWEKQKEMENNIKRDIIGIPIEYKLGMAVYHKDVYDGHEPLEVVGIRENELELRGDYSGMNNTIGDCWLPIYGVLIDKKQ